MAREPLSRQRRNAVIAAWLFTVGFMVFAMVILGGVTRLTHSGLSMVEWRPVTGWLPPLGEGEWGAAFAKYREKPEYLKMNLGMTLPEFKAIFWFEYLHRLWGRLIGVAFFVPFVFFLARGWVDRTLAPKLAALFVLGGLQGVLGWYMVKSGLIDRPDVSQYRLTAHFGAALAILSYILWVALGLLRPDSLPLQETGEGPRARSLWRFSIAIAALVFITALSGGFVAGLDAGFVYNTFPLMDGKLIPDEIFTLDPLYLNFFEDIKTVQFDHRVLAETVAVLIALFWFRARNIPLVPGARRAVNALALAGLVQVGLGITTLLMVVPVPVASAHQAGAVVLLLTSLWTVHALRLRLTL